MFFSSKQKKLESLLSSYCEQVVICQCHLETAMCQYSKSNDISELHHNASQVYKAESTADDLRHNIEELMYLKAIFPSSRGDILNLLESVDKIPNQAESSIRMLINQHISISDNFWPDILAMIELTCSCVATLVKAMNQLFSNFASARTAVGKVDELESAIDNIEYGLIDKVFSSAIAGDQKLLLRDIIKSIASISDRAENSADRLRIILAKRGV